MSKERHNRYANLLLDTNSTKRWCITWETVETLKAHNETASDYVSAWERTTTVYAPNMTMALSKFTEKFPNRMPVNISIDTDSGKEEVIQ